MKLPNIVITGTPGTGKTTFASVLQETIEEELGDKFEHINIGDVVKNKHCHDGFNEKWQTYEVNEDKLLDELEPIQNEGGKILDWHTCDMFPERWVDLVLVLRCPHTMLWNRLEKRGYEEHKIQENNMAEIMNIAYEEAMESYNENIVVEMESKEYSDMETNASRVVEWLKAWKEQHA